MTAAQPSLLTRRATVWMWTCGCGIGWTWTGEEFVAPATASRRLPSAATLRPKPSRPQGASVGRNETSM
jgi:hypothetical protein